MAPGKKSGKKSGKGRGPGPQQSPDGDRNRKMRPANDVIQRIRWDSTISSSLVIVGYEDRFVGVKERPFDEFNWVDDLGSLSHKAVAIPRHRIVYFKYRDTVIWNRPERLDCVFGSANTGIKLEEIVAKIDAQHQARLDTMMNADNDNDDDDDNKKHNKKRDNDDDDDEDDDNDNAQMGEEDEADAARLFRRMRVQDDDQRPNYFISLRIDRPTVVDQLCAWQDTLVQRLPWLRDHLIPQQAFHITLVTLRCTASTDIAAAAVALRSFRNKLCQIVKPRRKFIVTTPALFGDRVAYAAVDESQCNLQRLVTELCAHMEAAGVVLCGNRTPFVPHITLAKPSRAALQRSGRMPHDLCDGMEAPKKTLWHCVEALHLNKMSPDKADDGHYQRVAHIPNAHTGVSAAAAVAEVSRRMQQSRSGLVVIMKGLPGSGKSTTVRMLKGLVEGQVEDGEKGQEGQGEGEQEQQKGKGEKSEEQGMKKEVKKEEKDTKQRQEGQESPQGVVVCSADAVIERAAKQQGISYQDAWNKQRVKAAHEECQKKFAKSLEQHASLVIVDNTNISPDRYEQYVSLAEEAGYPWCVVELGCFSREQAHRFFKRNTHGLDAQSFFRMYNMWQPAPADAHTILIDQYDLTSTLASRGGPCTDASAAASAVTGTSNPLISGGGDSATTNSDSDNNDDAGVSVKLDPPSLPSNVNQRGDGSPTANRGEVVYTGLFLTKEARAQLREHFSPRHSTLHLDHVTLAHHPAAETWLALPFGKRVRVVVNKEVYDAKGQALCVSWNGVEKSASSGDSSDSNSAGDDADTALVSRNAHPHITVSTASGVEAVYSNTLLGHAAMDEGADADDAEGLQGEAGANREARAVDSARSSDAALRGDAAKTRTLASPVAVDAVVGVCYKDRVGFTKVSHSRSEVVSAVASSAQPLTMGMDSTAAKRELFVFDFDNTLVLVPGKEEGSRFYWQQYGTPWRKESFVAHPESLAPYMPLYPGPAMRLFHHVLHARDNAEIVVLTGRLAHMHQHVQRVLHAFGACPSSFRLLCHPGGGQDTSVFKRETVRDMWATSRYGYITFVDDLGKTLSSIESLRRDCDARVSVIDANTMWALPELTSPAQSDSQQQEQQQEQGQQQQEQQQEQGQQQQQPPDVAARVGAVVGLVDEIGLLSRPHGYEAAVRAGISLIEACWRRVLRACASDPAYAAIFDTKAARALIFGSHTLGCLSDVDVCLVAPLVRSSYDVQPSALVSQLFVALQSKGVTDIYLADTARCPRLVARFACTNNVTVTFDLVSAVVPASRVDDVVVAPSDALIPPFAANDTTSYIALDGVSLHRALHTLLRSRGVRVRAAASVLEMMRLLLRSVGLYGKAARGVARYHLIMALMQTIRELKTAQRQQTGEGDGPSTDELFSALVSFLAKGNGSCVVPEEADARDRAQCWRAVADACKQWQHALRRMGLATATLCRLVMEHRWREMSDREGAVASTLQQISQDQHEQQKQEEEQEEEEKEEEKEGEGGAHRGAADSCGDAKTGSAASSTPKPTTTGTGTATAGMTAVGRELVFALSGERGASAVWQASLFLHARLPTYLTRLRREMAHTTTSTTPQRSGAKGSKGRSGSDVGVVRCFNGERRFADIFERPEHHPVDSKDAHVRMVLWRQASRDTVLPALQPLWRELEHFRAQGVCMALSLGGVAVFRDTVTASSSWTDARVSQAVREFVASSDRTRALPSHLTAYQRKLVHGICDRLPHVTSRSEGQGALRHTVLSKTQ